MSRPTLYIANKNYSSWSLRPWIGMKAKGVPFEENLQTFDIRPTDRNPHFRAFSPTGKVPVLAGRRTDRLGIPGHPRVRGRAQPGQGVVAGRFGIPGDRSVDLARDARRIHGLA